jgi:hypothetical protein
METRIKLPQFSQALSTISNSIVRQPLAANVFACSSVLQHNFAMRSLDNKIWKNKRQDVIKHSASSLPVINRTIKFLFTRPSISRVFRSPKRFFKPQYNNFITTNYLKERMPLATSTIYTLMKIANKKTSLSVNYSSKVSNLSNRLSGVEFNVSTHVIPFVYNNIILNEDKTSGERLSEKTPRRGCDSLTSIRKIERRIRRGSSAYYVGHKSNRMVLNEATIRLGVSMRQTEDELTRDALIATGSVINCTNGTNGDTITELTRPDINGVIAALADANAMTVSELIDGEDKFGSAPVRDAYWCMASTKLIGDIDTCLGFTPKANYPSQHAVLKSEYAAVSSVRFVLSSIASYTLNASGLGRTVFNNIVTGMQSYANISVDEYNAKLIYRSPMYNDPLAQNCTLGYKFAECPVILNDALLVNMRCTRSI